MLTILWLTRNIFRVKILDFLLKVILVNGNIPRIGNQIPFSPPCDRGYLFYANSFLKFVLDSCVVKKFISDTNSTNPNSNTDDFL